MPGGLTGNILAFPRFGWLVASFSLWRPGFDPRPVHV
jgi:hypothetical protein